MSLVTDSTDLLTIAATSGGADLVTDTTIPVVNPATGRAFALAPAVTPEQLSGVFETAQAAFPEWSADEDRRRQVLRDFATALRADIDTIAPILTAEQGHPLADSVGELEASARWLDYYADLELPREIIRDDAEAYEEVVRRPMGVVSAITPWNVPIALAMWKIAPALRAGNTIVVKPSQFTPMATLALGRLARGIVPDGVLNVVSGKLGSEMVSHPIPRKVSFTGSTDVGKTVALNAAADLKRVTLELGGNDPAIVLADVDVAEMAERLFWNGFMNNGQICFAAKRVYAHRDVKDQLVEALAEVAKLVKVADGMAAGAQLGPVNNRAQFDRVSELVDDAVQGGARVVAGGARLGDEGYFYAPTIIDRVDDGVRVVDEEQFGPVMPIVSFTDEADAVRRANASEYGLTASVWSGDAEHALALAHGIDAGQVGINRHGRGVRPHLPFGGHKWSGIGVENGPWGLYGFTEIQVLAGPSRS
jgi:acyl-CoA reductase-like NAD-dependent aldehyde dehydrogenase